MIFDRGNNIVEEVCTLKKDDTIKCDSILKFSTKTDLEVNAIENKQLELKYQVKIN